MTDETSFFELPLVRSILERLQSDLSPGLVYHSWEHTCEVIREALKLGSHEGLPPRDLELLAVAAAYHDSGFLRQSRDNEAVAAAAAAEAMREGARYDAGEIALVSQMILDTELRIIGGAPRQIPSTRLSPYLLDADLGNLGREDFLDKARLMMQESGEPDERKFYTGLLQLLENHTWYTTEAARENTARQKANIDRLKKLLGA